MYILTRVASLAIAVIAGLIACSMDTLRAADYPDRPISMVIAYPPGGANDELGRVVAHQMEGLLKQPVVVVNRTGAAGTVGAGYVAHAVPDGYTILFAESSLLVAPHIYHSLDFGLDSFTPIASIGSVPLGIVSAPSFPAKNLSELVALLKSKPGQFSFASGGVGTIPYVSGELFQNIAGVKLLHVPYRGGGTELADVMSSTVSLAFIGVSPILPLVSAGKLNLLAVTSPNRVSYSPSTAAVAELYPGFDTAMHYFVLAPPGLPPATMDALRTAIQTAIQSTDVKDAFTRQGAIVEDKQPADLAAQLTTESDRWGRIVKDLGIAIQ